MSDVLTIGARLWATMQLTRLDRPIGSLLLLWPTLAGLWIAQQGQVDLFLIGLFIAGVFVMRSAGCIANDIADRNIDPHVERTKHRPLADGRLSVRYAVVCLAVVLVVALVIVLQMNVLTRWMAAAGLLIAIVYPLTKRITYFPQLVLGVAFSWGILMASTASTETIPLEIWILALANFLWITAYDTQYAMVDAEYDKKIGVKSTALYFGTHARKAVVVLQAGATILFISAGVFAELAWFFYLGMLLVIESFVHQYVMTVEATPEDWLRAFKANGWTGAWLFLGVALSWAIGMPYNLFS